MFASRKRNPGRTRRPRPDKDGTALRRFAVRLCAVAALGALVGLGLMELCELRGELAFVRFCKVARFADEARARGAITRAVREGLVEAELILRFGRGSADALWEVTVTCSRWSQDADLDPLLRLRMGETAARAAVLWVRAAPSDYEPWLWLARAHAALGLNAQSRLCLERAQQLAPRGTRLELFPA